MARNATESPDGSGKVGEVPDLECRTPTLRAEDDGEDSDASTTAFLTVEEAAVMLRIDKKTLYEAVKKGQVACAVRVGGVIRINRLGLLEWGRGKGDPALGGKS